MSLVAALNSTVAPAVSKTLPTHASSARPFLGGGIVEKASSSCEVSSAGLAADRLWIWDFFGRFRPKAFWDGFRRPSTSSTRTRGSEAKARGISVSSPYNDDWLSNAYGNMRRHQGGRKQQVLTSAGPVFAALG
jgi:hypothetical protein